MKGILTPDILLYEVTTFVIKGDIMIFFSCSFSKEAECVNLA